MKITAATILLWIGVAIGASVTASWAMMTKHADSIHRRSVEKTWYMYQLEQDKEWRRVHTEALRDLHRDMKELLTRILEKQRL